MKLIELNMLVRALTNLKNDRRKFFTPEESRTLDDLISRMSMLRSLHGTEQIAELRKRNDALREENEELQRQLSVARTELQLEREAVVYNGEEN